MDGTTTTLQLVLPGQYRQQIVQELHSGVLVDHLGADMMHGRVKNMHVLLVWALEQCAITL